MNRDMIIEIFQHVSMYIVQILLGVLIIEVMVRLTLALYKSMII